MFDVAFSNAGRSYELQTKISDVFHNQLMDGMEQLFSRLVPNDTVLTLNEVNIDIGSIAYNLIEYDLVDRILAELEREINYRLALRPSGNSNQDKGQQFKNVETGYTNLLEYFLLTGAMPWWATGEQLTDPVAVMEHLIAKDATGLKQLILKVGQYSYVRQRLVYQFSAQVIRNLITILEPGQAAFIFDYHASVVQTHHEEKLIEGATNTEFDKALWLFILTYILVDRGSFFNRKIFVRSTLEQMARHYNLSYAQILALLSKALASHNLTDVHNSNLTLIISELSVDEFDDRREQVLNITNGSGEADEVVQQNIELIKYYLVFGSLPWWSEPYTESGLVTIVLSLIKVVPKALTKLIVAIGQREDVRKRIATVFDDEVITAIVKLLEPANAAFIINYVEEVQVIHVKKPVVYTDGKDFKKAVWKFIFDFLLIERGSVFNERMFLDSNIRKLASSYNVQYADMLIYLVQSIGQVHQASIEHAPLFQLLAGLLNDFNQKTPGYYERADQQKLTYGQQELVYAENGLVYDQQSGKVIPDIQKRKTVVLKDVLLHWLTYGNIPWWGSQYFDEGPEVMFQLLLTTAPADAFMLLKYAGTIPNLRKRVIYQLSEQLIVALLSKQPGGDNAVKLYQYLAQALAKVKGTATSIGSSHVLLLAFWDAYIAGQYKKFDSVSFIKKGIYALIKQQGIKQQTIIAALKRVFASANEVTYLKDLETLVLIDDVESDLLVVEQFTADVDILQSLTHYLSTKAPGRQAIAEEVLNILTYFLNNNKLPVQFKGTNPAYIKAVIGQLLQLLKRSAPKAYKQLLLDSKELKAYVQDAADTGILIEGSIEQLIGNYLLRDKQPQKEDILNEALAILEHFLTTGKLPVPFAGANVSQILKQLLLLLNYERRATLNSILQRDSYLAEARMQLHNLFAITANTAENNVSRTLKAYFEKDIIQYIKQQPGSVFDTDDTLAAILDGYIKEAEGKLHLIIPLLKNQAVARYIARHYTDVQVDNLLNNNATLIGGTENLVWLNSLQLLITTHVTDTLQRARLTTLLREFNLQVLGEHITVSSFTAYLKQLLNFISSANYSLFTVLSKVMLKAGSTPGLSPVFTAKLSQVLTELHIYEINYKTAQSVKQLLVKADDNALQGATGSNTAKKAIETKQLKEEIKQNQQLIEETMKDQNKELLINSKDTIYINNAGLVLLNPFLATYFVRLGMMEGGKFVNADMQLRAVHLLQYLVNGKSDSPEHFLVLNKVFCNVPIEEPVQAEIILTEKEKAVSEELLKAVLNSWDKLKNTSIVGLQESFLQRDGGLVFKDDAWHLKIEQRGYDVLLQTLPWTIGMIKTPWMDKFLYVEWT